MVLDSRAFVQRCQRAASHHVAVVDALLQLRGGGGKDDDQAGGHECEHECVFMHAAHMCCPEFASTSFCAAGRRRAMLCFRDILVYVFFPNPAWLLERPLSFISQNIRRVLQARATPGGSLPPPVRAQLEGFLSEAVSLQSMFGNTKELADMPLPRLLAVGSCLERGLPYLHGRRGWPLLGLTQHFTQRNSEPVQVDVLLWRTVDRLVAAFGAAPTARPDPPAMTTTAALLSFRARDSEGAARRWAVHCFAVGLKRCQDECLLGAARGASSEILVAAYQGGVLAAETAWERAALPALESCVLAAWSSPPDRAPIPGQDSFREWARALPRFEGWGRLKALLAGSLGRAEAGTDDDVLNPFADTQPSPPAWGREEEGEGGGGGGGGQVQDCLSVDGLGQHFVQIWLNVLNLSRQSGGFIADVLDTASSQCFIQQVQARQPWAEAPREGADDASTRMLFDGARGIMACMLVQLFHGLLPKIERLIERPESPSESARCADWGACEALSGAYEKLVAQHAHSYHRQALGRYRQLLAGAHTLGLSAGPGVQPPAEQLQALCDEVQQRAWGRDDDDKKEEPAEQQQQIGLEVYLLGPIWQERKKLVCSLWLLSIYWTGGRIACARPQSCRSYFEESIRPGLGRLWLLTLQGYDRLVQRLLTELPSRSAARSSLQESCRDEYELLQQVDEARLAAAPDDDDVLAGLRFQPGALEPWAQLLTRATLDTPAPELLRCSRTLAEEGRLCVKEALDLWAEVAAFARRSCRWDMPELLLPPDWQWSNTEHLAEPLSRWLQRTWLAHEFVLKGYQRVVFKEGGRAVESSQGLSAE